MTRRYPALRYRLDRCVVLTADLRLFQGNDQAEVTFHWYDDETDGPIHWLTRGYYWRPQPGATWSFIGSSIGTARLWVNRESATKRKRREKAAEVAESVAETLLVGVASMLPTLLGETVRGRYHAGP